jgi:hypothetical protein
MLISGRIVLDRFKVSLAEADFVEQLLDEARHC